MNNERNSLSLFLSELYNIEPLSIAEEHALAPKIKAGDIDALDRIITHNLRYVISLVKKLPTWTYGRVDIEDLVSAGYEGMITASKRWEPQEGIRFIGFAKPFIERSVMRCVENTGNIIRLPVNVSEEIRKLKYHERILMQEVGRQPSVSELAQRLDIPEMRVHQLRGYLQREPKSLDAINTEHLETDSDD